MAAAGQIEGGAFLRPLRPDDQLKVKDDRSGVDLELETLVHVLILYNYQRLFKENHEKNGFSLF